MLTPLAVGPGQPFPYISALSLSLGVFVRDPKSGEERFARVKVPELLPRFISVGKRDLFLPLEHVITYSLTVAVPEDGDHRVRAVPGHEGRRLRGLGRSRRPARSGRARIAATTVRRHRPRRDRRLDVGRDARRIKAGLGARDDQIYPVDGLLDLADLNQIVDLDRPDLKEEPLARRDPTAPRRRRRPAASSSTRSGAATSSCTSRTSRSRRASRRSSRPPRATRT